MSIKTAERNSGILPEDNVIHHRHLIAYQEAARHCHGNVLEIGSGEGYGIKNTGSLRFSLLCSG